ncbi:MAG: HAD family phosphatase [Clostridia bacterium]|nr:HAD family phosphatase [Clostridia bacterium]
MIKNLVFDFGQVMVHFEPAYMVGQYVSDETDAALLEEVIFDRLYWDRLDAGTITDEEVLEGCRGRLPERLWPVAETIYWNWIRHIPEIEGMGELTTFFIETYGVRLILLSNISTYFAAHAHEMEILKPFDRLIFSAVCGHVKPHADMFAYLCETCGLVPEETLFVDDNAANIKGAREFGLQAYHFDGDVPRLRAYLNGLF